MENIPTWLPVVAIALRTEGNRWLLHKRPDGKAHGGLWEFPGGKVEPGETPRQALARECAEELGIIVEPGDLYPAFFADEECSDPIVIILYTCSQWQGDPQAMEGGAIEWFTPAEAGLVSMPPLDLILRSRLDAIGWRQ